MARFRRDPRPKCPICNIQAVLHCLNPECKLFACWCCSHFGDGVNVWVALPGASIIEGPEPHFEGSDG